MDYTIRVPYRFLFIALLAAIRLPIITAVRSQNYRYIAPHLKNLINDNS
ncbi:hypothetical protein [Acetobacterium woodii]|nr:hypothetical protein [Acetobacterium woodii]